MIKNFVINKKVDSKTLDYLEDFLIESDVGVVAAKELKQIFADTKIDPKKDSLDQVNLIVENYIKNLMLPLEKKIVLEESIKPKVILIAGVNGVGKTTTIGKLGKIFSKDNKQIVFAAAGASGLGVLQQASDSNKLAIGVDSNQNSIQPGFVLTSMVKNLDEAIEGKKRKKFHTH